MHHIIETGDGSHSVLVPGWNVTYHSRFWAITESQHIFINSGLKYILKDQPGISILEVGFGTGLNTLLTLIETQLLAVKVFYETLETQPLEPSIFSQLNYPAVLGKPEMRGLFNEIHESEWNCIQTISTNFQLLKRREDITDAAFSRRFDVVYFDAFDPQVQPGLWKEAVFSKIFDAMNEGAVLVTYCSKTVVRKAMEKAGFTVEKLKGPLGKREISRGKK